MGLPLSTQTNLLKEELSVIHTSTAQNVLQEKRK